MVQPETPAPALPWWRQFWYKNFLGLVPYTFVSPSGIRIPCRRRYEIRMCEKIFGCQQYPLDQLGHPIHTVLDVGANIGVFSFYCADAFRNTLKSIHCVEPFSKNVARIGAVTRANHLDSLIHPIRAAVNDQPGTADLLLADSHYSNSILASKVKSPNARETVPVTTLDRIRAEQKLGEIDLLKLDVEGVELPALAAGTEVLKHTRALVIEAHKGFCTFGDLVSLLRPYQLVPLNGTTANPGDFGDFCFVRKP